MGFHVYIIYITLLSISEDKSKINKPPIFHPIKTYGVMNGPPGPPKKNMVHHRPIQKGTMFLSKNLCSI